MTAAPTRLPRRELSLGRPDGFRGLRGLLVLAITAAPGVAALPAQEPEPGRLLEAIVSMARTSSVVGREGQAAEHVRALLVGLDVRTDALGSLTVEFGSGSPRLLLAVPLDEPGYVVTRIQEDGFVRITPVGQGYRGALAHQYLEGNEISVITTAGSVPGAVGVPSAHLTSFTEDRVSDWVPFAWQDAYVDVGADSAGEAAALGVRPMDTLTLIKRPTVLHGQKVAAPSVQVKAAAVALAEAAHRIAVDPGDGTVVLAWTTLGLINGRGLEAVVRANGPFDEAYVFSRNFGWGFEEQTFVVPPSPAPGAGVLSAAPLAGATEAPHLQMFRGAMSGGVWAEAEVHYVGLPTQYQDTPVETVDAGDVAALADLYAAVAGADAPPVELPVVRVASAAVLDDDRPFAELSLTLGSLVARYGVSGNEAAVRAQIESLLPAWADPEVDDAGNVSISVGQGEEHIVFVAHMDETGYRVREIRDDGRLVLDTVGGNLNWVWEAQAALVHTAGGDVAAVFEPRLGHVNARSRASGDPLTAYVGTKTRAGVEDLGIRVGDTLTMPKAMRRIGWHRALARAFDDRAGSVALLEAIRRIDPAALPRRVTFAWSVGEEIGLIGAQLLAERFDDAIIVYPVDTFVSSDAPLESRRTAYAPLGDGFVIRVVESINFAPADLVAHVQALALAHDIPTQLGMTSGGTDGQPWVARGIPSVPISWPGRYSHSPIEVLDLRDLDALVRMIVVLAEEHAESE